MRSDKSIRVCHISTLHRRDDVRIFHKECSALSERFSVSFIVADGLGDEHTNGIAIYDVGKRHTSRIKRMRIDSEKAYNKAMTLDCHIYHIHDPELLGMGVRLKEKHHKTVIYDAHEDLPMQVLSKSYIPSPLRPIVSKLVAWQLKRQTKRLDYVVAATPFIKDTFLSFMPAVVDVNNYPIVDRGTAVAEDDEREERAICYVGGISENRGVFELIESLPLTDAVLYLAGDFKSVDFKERCMRSKGWKQVRYKGFVSREEVAAILRTSRAGIVTLHPLPNYLDSLPIKMFEYMSAAIPVIASDFPYWQQILQENRCGITVNPLEPSAIADAINSVLSQPAWASEMGENGRVAVMEKYNWGIESKKLLAVYDALAKGLG